LVGEGPTSFRYQAFFQSAVFLDRLVSPDPPCRAFVRVFPFPLPNGGPPFFEQYGRSCPPPPFPPAGPHRVVAIFGAVEGSLPPAFVVFFPTFYFCVLSINPSMKLPHYRIWSPFFFPREILPASPRSATTSPPRGVLFSTMYCFSLFPPLSFSLSSRRVVALSPLPPSPSDDAVSAPEVKPSVDLTTPSPAPYRFK